MTQLLGMGVRGKATDRADVVLGEDWVAPEGVVDFELKAGRERSGIISLNRSPLARKIITFNLLAMIVLVAGVLYLNPFRNSLVLQREGGLVAEAQLIADVFEAGETEAEFAVRYAELAAMVPISSPSSRLRSPSTDSSWASDRRPSEMTLGGKCGR